MSRVHVFVFASAVALLVSVLNFVRRRRLREEYSWFWLLASISYLLLTVSPALYRWVARLIGATNAALAFTFLGLYFLTLISIQFSIQLSKLMTRSKDLAQEVAILDGEVRKLQQMVGIAHTSHHTAQRSDGNGSDLDKHAIASVVTGAASRAAE